MKRTVHQNAVPHLTDRQKSKPQSQNSAMKLWETDDSYLSGRKQNDDLTRCGKTFHRITETLHVLYLWTDTAPTPAHVGNDQTQDYSLRRGYNSKSAANSPVLIYLAKWHHSGILHSCEKEDKNKKRMRMLSPSLHSRIYSEKKWVTAKCIKGAVFCV